MAKKKSQSTKNTKRKQAAPPPGLLVSERVQLQDVRLWQCACEQREEAHVDGKKRYKITHSARIEVDKANGRICVWPKFHFEAFNEDQDQAVITVNATFLLIYSINCCAGLVQRGYQQFANMNGIYNAWPYWREFVQATIARMGLPALVLPVFRIMEPGKRQTKKRETSAVPEAQTKGPAKAGQSAARRT